MPITTPYLKEYFTRSIKSGVFFCQGLESIWVFELLEEGPSDRRMGCVGTGTAGLSIYSSIWHGRHLTQSVYATLTSCKLKECSRIGRKCGVKGPNKTSF